MQGPYLPALPHSGNTRARSANPLPTTKGSLRKGSPKQHVRPVGDQGCRTMPPAYSNSPAKSPYPSASRASRGMKRRAAEFMQ